MTVTRHCGPHPELVGAKYWLPVEPFEYGWAPLVGCNRMRCLRCGQPVRTDVLGDVYRRYACGCRQHDEAWSCRVDDGDHVVNLTVPTGWHCQGHPALSLPTELDGVALTVDGDWAAVVRRGSVRPPFTPPGVELEAPWITRLYRLLAGEPARRALSEAVADAVNDLESAVVAAAFGFFINEPAAPGAERLAASTLARGTWLAETAHPAHPGSSLLETAAVSLHERLLVIDTAGRPVDGPALAAAKMLALEGVGPSTAPFTFHDHDPEWLWNHAGELVRAHGHWLGRIAYVLAGAPRDRRVQVVRAIAGIGDEARRALCAEISETFADPERGELLSAMTPPRDEER